jgi:transcription antitermination factor NusG
MGREIEGWFILRTQARHTVRLAESLAEDGFEVWTPIETRVERVGKSRRRVESRLPIMGTYVFAKARHLVDLLQLAAMPVKPRRGAGLLQPAHAGFSVMRWRDKIPMVADRQLRELRRLQAKLSPARKPSTATKKADEPLPVGMGVRLTRSGFQGLKGTIERSDRRYTIVSISERFRVTLDTCLIDPDDLCETDIPAVSEAA